MSSGASKKLTAIDLFAGAGGLTQGLRDADFNVVGAVEIDSVAVESYLLNHRSVRVWQGDIVSLSPKEIMDALNLLPGDLDLLAGCPPCQGFSQMRINRKEKNSIIESDRRNDLVFQFLRFVDEMLPKSIMLENVPALATDARMLTIKKKLLDMGYVINNNSIKILNVADYGVPQRRTRMILMASLYGEIPFAEKVEVHQTVRDAISKLPPAGTSGDILHDIKENRSAKIIDFIKKIKKDGGSRSDLGPDAQLECHKRCRGFSDVYGRMAWDKVAPTITGGCSSPSKGRFLHPSEDRCITLREAAILQGFPSDYDFSLRKGKFAVAQMIGNALPPLFIQQHALNISKILTQVKEADLGNLS